jgi:biotin carboxylase
MNKTIMIIGAGTEQLPAYRIAKERGFNIIGTDIDKNAPGFKLADHALHVSTKDADETTKLAIELNKEIRIDGVMTIASDVPYTVSLVSESLGLKSISLSAAKNASDKLLMKECFLKKNIQCPWFSKINSITELKEVLESKPNSDFVLKPIDGSGARGVLMINLNSDIEWSFSESLYWSNSKVLILEEFIGGTQLSTDSFILDGVCHTPAISERNYSKLSLFKPYIIEDGGTIPAQIDSDMHARICNLILRGASSLGIDHGPIKGDLVIDKHGNPLIIELAARLSGGWLSTHQIPFATGVNLVDIVLSDALGLKFDHQILVPKKLKSTAIRYWFPKPGIIKNIKGKTKLNKAPGLIKYGFFRGVGDEQPVVRMHPDRFGYVIVSGETRIQACERAEYALSSLEIETKMEQCLN